MTSTSQVRFTGSCPADAKLWRRGPEPVAAGPHDYGYFGPSSVVWKVAAHPATLLMTAQVTGVFEMPHKMIQAVTYAHDPFVLAAAKGRPVGGMAVRRFQRTVGVPMPMIFGDKPSADSVAKHLRSLHGRFTGTIPGTSESYDAQAPDSVLFAHVTIFHAALRSYETLAYRDGHGPRRLSAADRDQYWRELVPFALLMGARAEDVPTSVAEVSSYYQSIAGDYGDVPGAAEANAALLRTVWRPKRWRDVEMVANIAAMVGVQVLAMAVAPTPARRLYGISPQLDPFLAAALRISKPSFAALATARVGDRVIRAMAGSEGLELVRAANREMKAVRRRLEA